MTRSSKENTKKMPLSEFPRPTRPKSMEGINTMPADLSIPHEERPIFHQEYHHPEALQLPKSSSRPQMDASSSYDPPSRYSQYPACQDELQDEILFSESVPVYSDTTGTDSEQDSEKVKMSFSPSTGKTPKGEKEAVDELLLILVDCMEQLSTKNRELLLKKFFSDIEKDERLEKFIEERLMHSKVKAISDLCEKLPARGQPEQIGQYWDGVDDTVLPGFDSSTEDGGGDYSASSTRSINESVEELSQKLEKFKVKTLDLGGEVQVVNGEEVPKK